MQQKVRLIRNIGIGQSEKLVNHRQRSAILNTTLYFCCQNQNRWDDRRLAEILENVSDDSVNRFLLRERYEPQDLFDTVKDIINLKGGILSVDDTVVEKHYSNPECAELIGYFWSGKYHKSIKGLNLITLYYSDRQDNSVPIN